MHFPSSSPFKFLRVKVEHNIFYRGRKSIFFSLAEKNVKEFQKLPFLNYGKLGLIIKIQPDLKKKKKKKKRSSLLEILEKADFKNEISQIPFMHKKFYSIKSLPRPKCF